MHRLQAIIRLVVVDCLRLRTLAASSQWYLCARAQGRNEIRNCCVRVMILIVQVQFV